MENLQNTIWMTQYGSTKYQYEQEKKIANLKKLRRCRLEQQQLLQQLIRNSESNQSLLAKQCLESMS
jgi:hypothetical protein